MPLIAERWDRFKLKRLMEKYQVSGIKLAKDMKIANWELTYMLNGKTKLIEHELFLTNYSCALKKARIKETIAFCEEMIKYYEEPV